MQVFSIHDFRKCLKFSCGTSKDLAASFSYSSQGEKKPGFLFWFQVHYIQVLKECPDQSVSSLL